MTEFNSLTKNVTLLIPTTHQIDKQAKRQTANLTSRKNVTIEFGNPKCECQNYGICKVNIGFESYFNQYTVKKSLGFVVSSSKKSFLLILKSSVAASSKAYYFNDSIFKIESRYFLSPALFPSSSTDQYYLEEGIYIDRIDSILIIPINKIIKTLK